MEARIIHNTVTGEPAGIEFTQTGDVEFDTLRRKAVLWFDTADDYSAIERTVEQEQAAGGGDMEVRESALAGICRAWAGVS